jgi:hypothetical protein
MSKQNLPKQTCLTVESRAYGEELAQLLEAVEELTA